MTNGKSCRFAFIQKQDPPVFAQLKVGCKSTLGGWKDGPIGIKSFKGKNSWCHSLDRLGQVFRIEGGMTYDDFSARSYAFAKNVNLRRAAIAVEKRRRLNFAKRFITSPK
jgi:hypothetical protein